MVHHGETHGEATPERELNLSTSVASELTAKCFRLMAIYISVFVIRTLRSNRDI